MIIGPDSLLQLFDSMFWINLNQQLFVLLHLSILNTAPYPKYPESDKYEHECNPALS